jgi:hypothetical protein
LIDASILGVIGAGLAVGGVVFGAGRVRAEIAAAAATVAELRLHVEQLAILHARLEARCPMCRGDHVPR